MKLFDRNESVKISLEENADQAILFAAKDLQRDLRRLSGNETGFSIKKGVFSESGIVIRTENGTEPEAYTVTISENCVSITGSDVLGTVFGIYAFSTRCLKVLPTHRFIDLFPKTREEMVVEEKSFSSPCRPVRFRGWFINDEDLLSDLEESGYERGLDYAYYKRVMHPDVMDAVVETALRLEYNLIIPATLLNLEKPGERALVEVAYNRGMMISQHHIEPMGVSHFSAEGYFQERGREEELSFASNPEAMKELWLHYAKLWSKYGDRVVWQLGLRGKKDEAVWKNDPAVPTTWEGRGALVTRAIQTQYDIICSVLEHDRFYSTATLWNEGSMLYGKGFLKLPQSTIPVLADFGIDQMFGGDMFTTVKNAGDCYGVYYHTSFWALGPHMAEGCHPEKMGYSYRLAASHGGLKYSMLNVSNVRPMHFSISMNAAILQDPMGTDVRKTVEDFDRSIFGESQKIITPLRYRYYDSFADFGDELASQFAEKWFFFYHDYKKLPFIRNAATDGQLTWIGKYALLGKLHCDLDYASRQRLPVLLESEEKLSSLLSEMNGAEGALSSEQLLYFRQFLKYQTQHLLLLTRWCIHCLDLVDPTLPLEQRKEKGKAACGFLEQILEERKILEQGKWKNWHKGDEKMNIPIRLQETRDYLAKL